MYSRIKAPLDISACSIVESEPSRPYFTGRPSFGRYIPVDDGHAVEQLVPYLEDTLIWIALGPRPSNEVFDPDAGRIHGLSDYVASLPTPWFLLVRSFEFVEAKDPTLEWVQMVPPPSRGHCVLVSLCIGAAFEPILL